MGYEENQAENKRNNTKTREITSVFNVTRKIVGNKTVMDGQPRAYLPSRTGHLEVFPFVAMLAWQDVLVFLGWL